MKDRIEIRQYETGDERHVTPIEATMRHHPDYQEIWDRVIQAERTWTALSENRIVAVGGFLPEGNTAAIWVLIDKTLNKTTILRIVKKGMSLFGSYNFAELYAYVQKNFEVGCRMLQHFGFTLNPVTDDCFVYVKRGS